MGKKETVTEYLNNLKPQDLTAFAAEFLGFEDEDINYDIALEFIDEITDDEVNEIYKLMSGE
jgi:hypothetical protein